MEVIVVDDGSTDDTSIRLDKFKGMIKYIYKENGGQASAFNVGIEAARGEYLIFLDSDDLCMPNRVSAVVDEFERYKDVGMVLNSRHVVGRGIDVWERLPECHNVSLAPSTAKLPRDCGYGTSRTSLRKATLQNILPIPEVLRIEADLYFLSILCYGNVSCLKDHLTTYRLHENNLFHTDDIRQMSAKATSIRLAIESVWLTSRKSPKFSEKLMAQILFPYEIESSECELAHRIHTGSATRKDVVSIELKKIRLSWADWPVLYKLYKLLRLPLFLIFPPIWVSKLSRMYSTNKLHRLRGWLFPSERN
jgi:glycosyltransferase involved in cell wall biosynthesis